MSPKWFTPSSARTALDTVRPAAERVRRLHRALAVLRPPQIASDQRVHPQYYAMVVRLRHCLDALDGAGVRLYDPLAGVVDFPARRGGRNVVLCWQVGEPSVRYWREVHAGLSGRHVVDDDGPWEEPRAAAGEERG